ncbi:serine protease [Vibrio metschnikovii]|uniref:serine protease n=1 Tax=Vibrio metschnikovii TaxID=28172 RepID=UPI00164BBEE3|nr:serine protease [Vibrio metschnikovii]MBC5830882.1 serine protease [Vibrio metschnikovii]
MIMKSLSIIMLGLVSVKAISQTSDTSQENCPSRIIGGQESKKEAWPFMAAFILNNAHDSYVGQFCAGTYLGDGYVLTAAHCIEEVMVKDFHVHLGIHDLKNADTEGKRSEVKAVYIHEQYNLPDSGNGYDIALVELYDKPDLPSIDLEPQYKDNKEILNNTILTIVGWGDRNPTMEAQDFPSTLHEVEVPYVLRASCQNLGEPYDEIGEESICAGYLSGGKDSCQADSGGPLLHVGDNGEIKQLGVVSWGLGCAQPNAYGVYANVSYFYDWIGKIKNSGISYTQYTRHNVTAAEKEGASIIKTLELSNVTSEPLAIHSIELEEGSALSIESNSCQKASPLGVGESCKIIVSTTFKQLFPYTWSNSPKEEYLVAHINRSAQRTDEKLRFKLEFNPKSVEWIEQPDKDTIDILPNRPLTFVHKHAGSISWSLVCLSLLSFLRYRKAKSNL